MQFIDHCMPHVAKQCKVWSNCSWFRLAVRVRSFINIFKALTGILWIVLWLVVSCCSVQVSFVDVQSYEDDFADYICIIVIIFFLSHGFIYYWSGSCFSYKNKLTCLPYTYCWRRKSNTCKLTVDRRNKRHLRSCVYHCQSIRI